MSRIYIPYLTTLNFVDIDEANIPQYISRSMDAYQQPHRLTPWEQLPTGMYMQPWVNSDVISLQIQNNAGSPVLYIVDCNMKNYGTFAMTQVRQNMYMPDYFIYESNSALTNVPIGGPYYGLLKIGSKTFISEAFKVTDGKTTLLAQFVNRSYYGDVIFETGFTPSIRFDGIIRLKSPASKDTVYEDQVLDMVMVQSKPYRIWELIIIAIPDWMTDKLNWVLGCSDVRLDGKYYSKNDGAKLEEQDVIGNGTLKTYKIELRESITRGSKIYDTSLNTNEQLYITLNSTSKGFADTSEDASSTIVSFTDVE